MPFTYAVLCTHNNCRNPAKYKVAARWTDGITAELKTYGLVCGDCLPGVFRRSVQKQNEYRFAPGESLDPPGIFVMQSGERDGVLERLVELERELLSQGPTS